MPNMYHVGIFAGYVALCSVLHSRFVHAVPQPYMDEPFHVAQTQAYCAGQWDEWDEKITTFPGLYIAATLVAWMRGNDASACALPALRSLNLLPAIATPWLLSSLMSSLHPSTRTTDHLANVVVLTLLPTHFFFHFLFYTDSFATCSVLALLRLALPRWPTNGHSSSACSASASASEDAVAGRGGAIGKASRSLAQFVVAALAIGFRQTNAVWVAFVAASCTLRLLQRMGSLIAPCTQGEYTEDVHSRSAECVSLASSTLVASLREVLSKLTSHIFPTLLAAHAPLLLLLCAFAAFVLSNGGVVVGDKSNHMPTVHGAQMLYLTGLASAPFVLHPHLTTDVIATLRSAVSDTHRFPAIAFFAALLVLICCHCTLGHAFLLADNRHYTFYLWRHVLGRHWAVRYMLAPVHLLLGYLFYPSLWRSQGALIALGLVACCALVLVPSPLIEPRYLTLPALLLRLHAPPLRGAAQWLPPLLLFVVLNAGVLLVFLGRPYVWGDGSEARLMW